MLVQQKSINDFIEQNENGIFSMLKKIVNTDSYSRLKALFVVLIPSKKEIQRFCFASLLSI
ncbi:hypothetical protein J6TS1_13330 [Siminovitchia terrae]|uniref:Uncharacterized protein n=1 Tax=Siminovitchia terrae TaxID=1914933 RepID=A0ABQ4KTU3_SIMTE|nr:hypothetical protein [Siminovitchia terrae]GIN95463.1 hypothetical protein J6TS1_13330 [Siminovitchia terrae]